MPFVTKYNIQLAIYHSFLLSLPIAYIHFTYLFYSLITVLVDSICAFTGIHPSLLFLAGYVCQSTWQWPESTQLFYTCLLCLLIELGSGRSPSISSIPGRLCLSKHLAVAGIHTTILYLSVMFVDRTRQWSESIHLFYSWQAMFVKALGSGRNLHNYSIPVCYVC